MSLRRSGTSTTASHYLLQCWKLISVVAATWSLQQKARSHPLKTMPAHLHSAVKKRYYMICLWSASQQKSQCYSRLLGLSWLVGAASHMLEEGLGALSQLQMVAALCAGASSDECQLRGMEGFVRMLRDADVEAATRFQL